MPTILTGGAAPRATAAAIAATHPDNLFTLLGDDYELEVTEYDLRGCARRYGVRARHDIEALTSGGRLWCATCARVARSPGSRSRRPGSDPVAGFAEADPPGA